MCCVNAKKEEYEKCIGEIRHYVFVAYALEKYVKKIWYDIAAIDAYMTIKKRDEIRYPQSLFLETAVEALINDVFIEVGACLDNESIYVKDEKHRRYNCSFKELKQLVKDSDNRLLPLNEIQSKIDYLMQLYDNKYKDIRNKTIAHNDLEKTFDRNFIDISIDQILVDFKKICSECFEILSLCLGCSLSKNYDMFYEEMLSSLYAIFGKEA